MSEKLSATAKVYRRRGLFMVLLAAVMLEATTLTQFFFARRDLKNEAQLRAKNELMVSSLKIESIMENVETATKNMAWVMTEHLDDTNELYDFFHQLLFTNPDIADVAMAFSPSYYPQMGYWFEPSSSRSEGGEIVDEEIGSEQHDYLSMPWFKKVFDSGIGSWSEPYFDNSGGKSMVVTYAEPVYDLDGKMAAVLGTDVSLSFLSSLVENVRLYPNSFSKITSREGRLLAASPDSVVSGKALRQEAEMSDTGWTMSIVIPQDEVFESINRLGHRVILLQILGLLLLWFILSRTIKEQAKLRQVEASKEKIESELKIASEIQMSMLPKIFPPFPERTDLDLAAAMYPAKEVGGDLYDFFIKEERLFFCIGDVSGKGVPASLLMAVTRSLFRTVSAHEKSPQRIVSAINDSMTGTNENNMFVTFFCGVLDLRTGHLRYCNAGHNAPFILKGTVGALCPEGNDIEDGLQNDQPHQPMVAKEAPRGFRLFHLGIHPITVNHFSATASRLKSAACRFASSPIRSRRSGSFISSTSLSSYSARSPSGTRYPFTRLLTRKPGPTLTSYATMGRAQLCASIRTKGKPSEREDMANTDARSISCSTCSLFICPGSST